MEQQSNRLSVLCCLPHASYEKHDIRPTQSGNVVPQEQEQEAIVPGMAVVPAREPAVTTAEILTRYKLSVDAAVATDHSYAVVCDKIDLSEFSLSIVSYMAGRVARKLCQKLSCCACKEILKLCKMINCWLEKMPVG